MTLKRHPFKPAVRNSKIAKIDAHCCAFRGMRICDHHQARGRKPIVPCVLGIVYILDER